MANATQTATAPSRTAAGISCVVIGMMIFVVQDGFMKHLIHEVPVWTLIVARAIIAVLILVPTIVLLGAPHRLLTPLWPLHVARALLFAFGFSLYYTVFPLMDLATVSTIFFSGPLFTALLAVVWLGESIGRQRIACLLVGFAGVIVAMNPTGDAFRVEAIFPVITAVTYAISQILTRKVGERESSLTLGLYTIDLAGVFIIPLGYAVNQFIDFGPEFSHLRWEWKVPDLHLGGTLAAMGVIGMVALILLSRAYQIASASLIAPFDYIYLPMAAAMAWIFWDEPASWNTIIGMTMIVASGLYLGYREVLQSRPKAERTPTAEVVFVPAGAVDALPHASDSRRYRSRKLRKSNSLDGMLPPY